MDQQIERRITSKTARNQGKTGEDGKARDAGLTPCLFVRVICRKHGEMRIAITEASEHCPKCSEPAYYYVLGRGGTRRGRAVEPEEKFRFESYSNVGL